MRVRRAETNPPRGDEKNKNSVWFSEENEKEQLNDSLVINKMLICQRQSTLSGLKTKKENELKGRDQEPVNQESMLRVLTV